jgi:hypothetical protein
MMSLSPRCVARHRDSDDGFVPSPGSFTLAIGNERGWGLILELQLGHRASKPGRNSSARLIIENLQVGDRRSVRK